MSFCIGRTSKCERFCDLYVYYSLVAFVFGAYMVHRSMRVGTVSIWGNSLKPFDLLGASDTAMLILIELPGWGSYVWWQHAYVLRDLDTLNRGCVTAEVSSLMRLANDAFRLIQDTSFRLKCLRLRCHDFSALADSLQNRHSTLHAQASVILRQCLLRLGYLFVYGAYIIVQCGYCQYLRQQFETIWFVGCLRHCHADLDWIARLRFICVVAARICLERPRHS